MTDILKEDEIVLSLKGKEALYAIDQMALSNHGVFKKTFEEILMDPQQQILHVFAIDYFVSLKDVFSKIDTYNLLYSRLISENFSHTHDGKLIMALMKIDPEQMIATLHQHSPKRQTYIIDAYLQLKLYTDYCLERQLRAEIARYPIEIQIGYFCNILEYIARQIEN